MKTANRAEARLRTRRGQARRRPVATRPPPESIASNLDDATIRSRSEWRSSSRWTAPVRLPVAIRIQGWVRRGPAGLGRWRAPRARRSEGRSTRRGRGRRRRRARRHPTARAEPTPSACRPHRRGRGPTRRATATGGEEREGVSATRRRRAQLCLEGKGFESEEGRVASGGARGDPRMEDRGRRETHRGVRPGRRDTANLRIAAVHGERRAERERGRVERRGRGRRRTSRRWRGGGRRRGVQRQLVLLLIFLGHREGSRRRVEAVNATPRARGGRLPRVRTCAEARRLQQSSLGKKFIEASLAVEPHRLCWSTCTTPLSTPVLLPTPTARPSRAG